MDIKKNDSLEKSLQVPRVFTKGETYFGLPSNIAVFGVIIGLMFFFELSRISGVAFLIGYFKLMYSVHENDPQGFEVWRRSIIKKRHGWCGTKVNSTQLIVIERNI